LPADHVAVYSRAVSSEVEHEPDRRGGERRATERRGGERRSSERRGGERRHYDPHGVRVTTSHGGRQNAYAAIWAIMGAAVVIYLFFIVLGGVEPGDAPVVSGIVLALAVIWFAHSWRRIIGGGGISASDRERRGF
jgi:hypothetical protein